MQLTDKQKEDIKKRYPNLPVENVQHAIDLYGPFKRSLGRQPRLLNGDKYSVCCGNCTHILIRDHGFGEGSCFIEGLWDVLEYGASSNTSSGYNDMDQCCRWWRPDHRTQARLGIPMKVEFCD